MIVTNKQNLPAGFVSAVSPKMHNEPGSLSATTLLKGAKEIILTERHWDEMTEDAADRFWALFGQAVHSLLEREGANDFTEETLTAEVDGVRITGRIDNYNMAEGIITDYKTASVWKVRFKDFADWRRQGLIYAWLLKQNGLPATKCRFVAILKDHSKTEAARSSEYPPAPVYIYEFDVTDEALAEIEEFIRGTVEVYLNNKEVPDDEIPECLPETRWAAPDKWAVMKKGRKSAIRVLESEEEAEAMAAQLGKEHYVEFRRGTSKKCESYCPCREFCHFYKETQEAQEEQEEAV